MIRICWFCKSATLQAIAADKDYRYQLNLTCLAIRFLVKKTKKAMHIIDIQYLNRVNHYKNTINFMHDLKANFDKILMITNTSLGDNLNKEGNLWNYPRKPNYLIMRLLLYLSARSAFLLIAKTGFWQSSKAIIQQILPTWSTSLITIKDAKGLPCGYKK